MPDRKTHHLTLGVLVSGRGTNLQAILDGCQDGTIPAKVGVVISNRPEALALDRARAKGVPVFTVSHKKYGCCPILAHGTRMK
jgi:phosphoribosylglycinamide formyltransferase-1